MRFCALLRAFAGSASSSALFFLAIVADLIPL
jgi:hypothetical protein